MQAMAGTRDASKESGRLLTTGGRCLSWTAPGRHPEVSSFANPVAGTTKRMGGSEPELSEKQDGDREEEGEVPIRGGGGDTCRTYQSMVGPSTGDEKEPEATGRRTTAHMDSKPKREVSPSHRLQHENTTSFSRNYEKVPSPSLSSKSGVEGPSETADHDHRNRCQNTAQRMKSKSARWVPLTADALRKQQQQYLPGAENRAGQIGPRNSRAEGVYRSDESGIRRQELSPLSLPQGLGTCSLRTQREEHGGLDRKNMDGKESAQHGGGLVHGSGGGMSPTAYTKTRRGAASSVGGDASPPRSTGEASPLATDERVNRQQHNPKQSSENASSRPRDGGKSEVIETKLTKQVEMEARNSNELPEQGGEAGAPERQPNKQAKRLALEVARLRSSLRATTSELETEQKSRLRLEVREILIRLTRFDSRWESFYGLQTASLLRT